MDHTTFFLGANSAQGFHSLYDDFTNRPGDFLHIIKGGPGTGKSTFMRNIGKAAESRGYEVEYILCSGDPDSLDGVYIPALGVGFADGTAPHVLDPDFFGVTCDYVNLGKFCDSAAVSAHGQEIQDVTRRYQAHYKNAYAYLAAAGAVDAVRSAAFRSPDTLSAVRRRADSAVRREFGSSRSKLPGHIAKRFLSAVSCKGMVFLEETLSALCERIYCLENRCGLAEEYLRTVLDGGARAGANAIACPSPLRPDTLEAVLFPEQQVAFIACQPKQKLTSREVKWVHLDAIPEKSLFRSQRRALLENSKQTAALLDAACDQLRQAKTLHDELETYYKPHLDIKGLNAYTKKVISGLF